MFDEYLKYFCSKCKITIYYFISNDYYKPYYCWICAKNNGDLGKLRDLDITKPRKKT